MSRKVPFDCTDPNYITDLLNGKERGKVSAIAPTCQTQKLCPKETQSCEVVVDTTLLALIGAQLARVNVGGHEVVRGDNGEVIGRKMKNVQKGPRKQKDGDLIH